MASDRLLALSITMRFAIVFTFGALLVLATHSSAAEAGSDSISQPISDPTLDSTILFDERSLLQARQSGNTTSPSSSSSSSTSSAAESTASGSAPAGGDATITESSCSMTNHLAMNQQASWGNGFVNTCCSFDRGVQCWYRVQSSVSAQEECEIPNCSELQSDDDAKMVGFVPLNSTNGSGKYGNVFMSLGMLSPGAVNIPAIRLMTATALLAVAYTTLL